jgi:hypothetical protein
VEDVMGRVLVAGLLIAMLSTAARADDFVDVCTAANKNDELQEKVCKCMSEKVKDDRPAFITMMKKLNEAQAKGSEPDPSKMTADEVKTLGTVMETLAACFQ